MTKANDFVRALRATQHGDAETVDEALNRQRAEWIRDLIALGASIRQWLAPVVEAGLASIESQDFALTEPDLGDYDGPGLTLTLLVAGENRKVRVRPRGMQIVGVVKTGGARAIGARGRVDIECGVAREVLLRFKDGEPTKWVSFSKGEQRTLDEELFFELLARVTELALP